MSAVGLVAIAGIAAADERPPAEIDLDDGVEEKLRADMLGLLLHLLHQPGALDDVGEARVVLDIRRDGELAAGLDALHQHGLEARAGGIDGRRVACRARAQDEHFTTMSCCHVPSASRQPHIFDIYANLAGDARYVLHAGRNCSQSAARILATLLRAWHGSGIDRGQRRKTGWLAQSSIESTGAFSATCSRMGA